MPDEPTTTSESGSGAQVPAPSLETAQTASPLPQALSETEGDMHAQSPVGDEAEQSDELAEVPSEETVLHHHFEAPAHVRLDRLDDDETFLIRSHESLDDVSELATDVARLGQLFPIDVRVTESEKLQIISGFRRVAALRFLQREKVIARLHTDLSDADAMLMALAAAIHSRSVETDALALVRERLEAEGHLTAAARDMLDKALATESSLGPESVEEEVDADELAGDVTMRLGQVNQDLSLLADVFEDLDDDRRESLLQQLRYSIDLVAFLESKK